MNPVSLSPIINDLDELFFIFNKQYFESKFSKPVISVSNDTTSGAYGWCTSWKAWADDNKDEHYEINLCSEYINRSLEEVCNTLIHEMVHLLMRQNDIQGTSRGGTYHNRKFKEHAEMHGLICENDAKYGWCITKLKNSTLQFIKTLNKNKFSLARKKTSDDKQSSSSSKSSTRKYVCGSCGVIIRATKEVNVVCGDCNVDFELED